MLASVYSKGQRDFMSDKKFKTLDRVRMHDTDAAGILYFARQFRFVHDALESFMENAGISFKDIFSKSEIDYTFVIVHAESDYHQPLHVGDHLHVHTSVVAIGKTSFTLLYEIYKEDMTKAGTAKTVHVTLDKKSKQARPVPENLKKIMENYVSER